MSINIEVILAQVIRKDESAQSMYSWCSSGQVSVRHLLSGERELLEFKVLPLELKDSLKSAFENIFRTLNTQEQEKFINRFVGQLSKIVADLPRLVKEKLAGGKQ